ncbi:MAG: DUF362 domain-containing protein [Phycisphaerae bacterium]|nr:DUF362 domain-containing protein [Phycisphaerae bacterium]
MGAVLAAGAAAAGGYLLHDPKGDAGLGDGAEGMRGTNGLKGLKNYFADVDFPASNPRISVALGDSPARESFLAPADIEKLVRAAVGGLDSARGMKRFISKGDVVLLKPNVGFDRPPHLGATTQPEVVRAVIRLCREAGAGRVVITDNPIESPRACFARSGLRRVAEAEGARILLPDQGRFEVLAIREREPDARRGEALGCWPILFQPLDEATKVIGMAPIKDHNLCSASMNLKNWYGLLGGRRNQLHQAIHNAVSDLGLLISPTLVIADATRVMMRNGPTGGRLSDVKPGGELGRPAVIAAVDPVACDAWCYQHLLGRDPARLTYLALSHEKIAARIAGGQRRFGERTWQVYDRQGKIVTTSL